MCDSMHVKITFVHVAAQVMEFIPARSSCVYTCMHHAAACTDKTRSLASA
jgi:hypothetical protein